MLVSTGGNTRSFLFYLPLAIDVATIALVRLKVVPAPAVWDVPLTVAFFIAWYAEFYARASWRRPPSLLRSRGGDSQRVAGAERGEISAARCGCLERSCCRLATRRLWRFAFYSVLEDSGHHALACLDDGGGWPPRIWA